MLISSFCFVLKRVATHAVGSLKPTLAPPCSRLSRSSEERGVLQTEVLAKAVVAAGMAVVLRPLQSPLCWCHPTERRKRPEMKAAQQSEYSKLCFDQSLESS